MLYRIQHHPETGMLERQAAATLAELNYKEDDLQKWLVRHLDQVIRTDELLPLTQSRRGEEMPDILAIDRNGRLFIFELKRWESDASNLLQVMRYAQIASEWEYEDLNLLYTREEPQRTELAAEHQEHFGYERPLDSETWNHDQTLVVITNGLDTSTRRAARYWKQKGLDLRPWIYRAYYLNDEVYLDINAFGEADDPFEDKRIRYHLVNTNYSNHPIAHDYMLKERRAAAFYDPWKYKIDNIERGDWVFLYQSGVGIVAFGQCHSSHPKIKAPVHGPDDQDDEHYVELAPYYRLSNPVPAAELRNAAEYHVPVVSTYTSIRTPGGDLLRDYCLKLSARVEHGP